VFIFGIVLGFAFLFLLSFSQIIQDPGFAIEHKANDSKSLDLSSFLRNLNRSFNAEGTINTILYAHQIPNEEPTNKDNNLDFNANLSESYILGGKWRLDVMNNNVTYFKINLTMTTIKGDGEHFHVIVFKPITRGISMLIPDTLGSKNFYFNPANKSLSFSGTVDVITNGVFEWRDVPLAASIYNNNVLRVNLDEFKTHHHFFGEPIFGLVNSIEPIANNASSSVR